MMNLSMQFFRKGLFILLICMGVVPLSIEAHAQSAATQKVIGRVANQKGELLQGVSVQEVGTSNGTATDERGTYEITVSGENAQLEFTYVGYKPKTMAVPKRGVLDVALDEIVAAGEEVIVVGFGTQKKASVVGAITTIAPKQLQLTPNRSLSNNLAGMVPGVIAVQRSGDPWHNNSDFWIRGVSTLTNSRPLVLVDGVERSLNDIDPEEIESFSVLKDAAASAVYGVRGANGVIMITTKRGKIGPPVVSVRFEGANTSPVKMPDYIGSVKYIELMNELARDAGKTPLFTEEILQKFRDQSDPELYPDINWWKAVARDHASSTRTNVNMAGGNDFLRYALELGYFDEKGLIKRDPKQEWNSELRVKRYNVRSNIDLNVTRTTLVRVSLGGFLQTRNGPPGDETNFGVFYNASRNPPFAHAIQYPNGEIPRVNFRENPWAFATQRGFEKWNNYSLQSLTSVEQDLKAITQGLKAKLTFSFDKFSGNSVIRSKNPDYYNPATGRDADGNLIMTLQSRGNQFLGYSTNSQWGNQAVYLEGMVSYARTFNNKHDINSMLLYNQRDYDVGEKTPYRTQGIAGRFSYTYDRRYIAEANFGYNGSENFAPGKRYGFFPAFAAGWIVSQEAFMEPVRDVISNLKIRGSWGMAGNSEIGGNRRFAYLSTIADFHSYRWGVNNTEYRLGRAEGDVGVPDLTWETAVKQDIGLELGLLKGAINFNIDFFKENRSDIFIVRNNVPGSAGFIRNIYANFGKVVNKGVEMSLTVDKQLSKDWHVSMMANYTNARNKRTEIDEPIALSGTYRSQTGTPVGQLFGLVAEGLFTEDDFGTDGKLKLGIPVPTFGEVLRPGDIRYSDLNGDGFINAADRTAIGGTRMPEVIYGFGATVRYKIVDLGFFFQGAGRTWQILGGENWLPGTSSGTAGNIYTNV
ncbi:MAG TPA: TonB-dependent receptor, partial [Niabella sp.]|nr:TonB-dependent receptor [Niabella sp.]